MKAKTVIITGGNKGVGQAVASKFEELGNNVVICGTSTNETFSNSLFIPTDVTKPREVDYLFNETISSFGGVDILINNAGNFSNALCYKMDYDTWNKVLNVNLNGVFYCTRKALKDTDVTRIINITSVQAQTGVIGASNYAAAKAGVIGFTKSIALEGARKGITANAISLGFIDIGMLHRLPKALQESILKKIPLGRFGKPEEVAETALFLSSEGAGYITGTVINVNGGYYAGG